MAMVAMGSGHADPVTKQDVSDKILDYIVEQLKPQPDGSHAVCVYSCIGNAGTNVHVKQNEAYHTST